MDNYTDKLFKGDFIMTREEFVKCVVSMLGYDEMAKASNGKCSFTDVTETMAGYVSTAEHLGIISGVGNDKFEPERALTFDEAVKILVCALGIKYSSGMGADLVAGIDGAVKFQVFGIDISLSALAVASIVGIVLNAILPGKDYDFNEENPPKETGANLEI